MKPRRRRGCKRDWCHLGPAYNRWPSRVNPLDTRRKSPMDRCKSGTTSISWRPPRSAPTTPQYLKRN